MLTVLLVPPDSGIIGEAISLVDHTPYDHVALDLGDGYVASEEFKGLTLWPSNRYTNPAIVHWTLPLSPEAAQTAKDWILGRVGGAYDYKQIFLDLLNVEFHLVLADTGDTYVCSGVTAAACKVAGWYPFDVPPHAVRPSHWWAAYQQLKTKSL